MRKIVLIAGPITGHAKTSHEYEKSVILLKHLLDTSRNLKDVTTEVYFKGWPQEPSALDDADTIVLISDGGDHRGEDHPLYVGDRLQQLERHMQRGCGLVQFHWSTFNPVRVHDKITEWVGGYFDYETGTGPRKWYSAITTKEWHVTLPRERHPICRGVQPFVVREEFYHNIRFRDQDPRLVPIAAAAPQDALEWTVGWAVERTDGGRGFGFTGGHFFSNWWNDDFRRLILNAIVWSSGAKVPAGGVSSSIDTPIKALILTGHNFPGHKWRPVAAALLVALEQNPYVRVEVSEEIEDLATERISAYDVLVLNYSNWDRPGLSDAAKTGFIKYLSEGGGLAVVHYANGAFNATLPTRSDTDWPEFRRIVRRVWMHGEGRSGHDPYGEFRVEVVPETEHPITRDLKAFDTLDELYFRQEGELPIVPLVTAHSNVTKRDEPLAWAYSYGEGRVFQTVLGHADESVRRAAALIRRGTVWAAGRRPMSFDPPWQLTEGALFRRGSSWSPALSEERAKARQAKESPHTDGTPTRDGENK